MHEFQAICDFIPGNGVFLLQYLCRALCFDPKSSTVEQFQPLIGPHADKIMDRLLKDSEFRAILEKKLGELNTAKA